MPDRKFRIVICRGPDCGDRRGSQALGEIFQQAVDDHGVAATTEIAWQSCFGRCTQGPNVLVREILPPDGQPTLGTGFATLPGPRGTTALYNAIDASRARVRSSPSTLSMAASPGSSSTRLALAVSG